MIPQRKINLLIVVAALGYFVDIYDLILFNVIKKESLIGIGISDPIVLKNTGIMLFNCQMAGMLIGGLVWGILGDKKGRIKVLFGSILLYSAANIANAFTYDITWYGIIRFIAGIGLAGELGAGITLVSEIMSKEKRGYGTMIIVTFGALGAVLAAFVGANGQLIGSALDGLMGLHLANWQIAYIIGGVLGLMLLLLRAGTIESELFHQVEKANVKKGAFLDLFKDKATFLKYLHCILIGLPIWYVIGILIALSEEFTKPGLLNIEGVITGTAVMYAYLGLSVGDLISGVLSQWLRSRKKVVMGYLYFSIFITLAFLFTSRGQSATYFYVLCFLAGAATGYWALFVTMASEQFGTNIRSTVTTTAPNFVRGAVIPITFTYKSLEGSIGAINSALVVGVICIGLAMYATRSVGETFAKDLDYTE